ncbi:hypothetical protein F4776DRAFT_652331 [Hypoxylon sp. NC0597]|nr:hypothetical protein F4776DRAFT_652331 [Hypoxylon sp. NC0597]
MEETNTLAALPAELIREIGCNLDTPAELLRFASICKHSYAAIGLEQIFKKDAVYQRGLDRHLHSNPDEQLDPWSERRGNLATFPKPSILWAIETNQDVGTIKRCIEIYLEEFPKGLEGKWHTSYPPPMCRAAQKGRLDVVQALFESGVSFRNWYNIKYPWCPWGMLKAFFGEYRPPHISLEMYVSAESGDAFKLACANGHEDITRFMIRNGLEFRIDDVFYAAKEGCLLTLQNLLRPLEPNTRQLIAEAVLKEIRKHHCARNIQVYKPLLAAAAPVQPPLYPGEPPCFDRVEWLGSLIVELINKLYDYRREEEKDWQDELKVARYKFKLTQDYNETMYLFNIFVQLDEFHSPESATKVAKAAAQVDTALEIIQTLIEQYPLSLGKQKSVRQTVLDELLLISVSCGSKAIAQYLQSFGCRFSSYHLEEAIMMDKSKMVDLILSSGIPATSTLKGAEYETPLHFALNRWKYASAFRLIDHGANLDDIPQQLKDLLLLRFHHHERAQLPSWRVGEAAMDRQIFAKRDDAPGYTNLYCNQLHAMYSLILGQGYVEEATRRFGKLASPNMRSRTGRLVGLADPDKWTLLASPAGAKIDHGVGYGWVVNNEVLTSSEFRGPAYDFRPPIY